jgi:hypothetical protein
MTNSRAVIVTFTIDPTDNSYQTEVSGPLQMNTLYSVLSDFIGRMESGELTNDRHPDWHVYASDEDGSEKPI